MKSKYFTPELARFLFDKGLLTIAERRHEEQRVPADTYPKATLLHGFVWAKTLEGWDFWERLRKEYEK